MAIQHQVLGAAGRDNALFVRLDTGDATYRLLFDCGEGCLTALAASEVQAVDVLFFSHLHTDHVAGFDAFLRLNYARPERPVLIYGPAGTTRALHHRLCGVTWNLVAGLPGEFRISDVEPDRLVTTRLLTTEAFELAHPAGEVPFEGVVHTAEGFRVHARIMDHGIPCLAYAVWEDVRRNIDLKVVASLGLKPGRWMQALKDPARSDDEVIATDGATHRLGDLRGPLLVSTPGASISYLTDFALDERAEADLAAMLRDCDRIVGETNYRDGDVNLARRNRHMTASEMGRLAARAGVRELILFHLSDRYTPQQWQALLEEVRQVFPGARFSSHWAFERDETERQEIPLIRRNRTPRRQTWAIRLFRGPSPPN
jgi:ribonuclease Z